MQTPQPSVLYLMNDLFGGGAQTGLLTLIDEGFFAGRTLHVAALVRGDGQLEDALRSRLPDGPDGPRLHVFSSVPRMRPRHLLQGFIVYVRLLRRVKPHDVVLSLPQANLVGRTAALLGLGRARLISFEHSSHYARKVYGPLLKLLSGRVQVVLADSAATGRHILQRFYRARRQPRLLVELPPYAGRPRTVNVKKEYALDPNRPLQLLMAGRLSAAKNHLAVLQAVQQLVAGGLPVHLTLAGSGELHSQLQATARQLGLAHNVTFLGYVADWLTLIPAADVYLQPSVREGLCITALEALHHGLPVVATPVGGMADYGTHNQNILFTLPETAGIAAAVHRLAADEDLRRRLGQHARSSIDHLYGPAATQAKLEQARVQLGWLANGTAAA